jgi:hypothetical protein
VVKREQEKPERDARQVEKQSLSKKPQHHLLKEEGRCCVLANTTIKLKK